MTLAEGEKCLDEALDGDGVIPSDLDIAVGEDCFFEVVANHRSLRRLLKKKEEGDLVVPNDVRGLFVGEEAEDGEEAEVVHRRHEARAEKERLR